MFLQLVIKPHSEDGLLLYSGKNDVKDFISLHLNFGKKAFLQLQSLTFTSLLNSIQVTLSFNMILDQESPLSGKMLILAFCALLTDSIFRSKLPISVNQWHSIKISRTARLAVMRVDDQPEVMSISPNGFWHLSLPYSLYLGIHFELSLAVYKQQLMYIFPSPRWRVQSQLSPSEFKGPRLFRWMHSKSRAN